VSGGPIWEEPAIGGYADRSVLGLSHLERNRAARQGLLPVSPMTYLTEMAFEDVSSGHASFSVPASRWLANSAGLIPGGALGPVADAALGASVGTELPAGILFTTAEISLSYVSPMRPHEGSRIVASGQAIHVGRSVGISEAFVLEEPAGRLLAHGTTRCAIFPPLDPIPEPPAELPPLDQAEPGSDPSHPLRRELRGESLGQDVFAARSGLEILRASIEGELPAPPLHHLTGMRPTFAAEGRVEWALPCSRWLSSPAGSVQGGFTAMLADTALTGAIFTTAPPGTAIASLDLKLNYLRPVLPDGGELLAQAKVTHRGRRLAVAGAELVKDGKRVGLASGSAMYLPGRPADLAGQEIPGGSDDQPLPSGATS
jgi:uncharacterized protein (TIGR00369 family)